MPVAIARLEYENELYPFAVTIQRNGRMSPLTVDSDLRLAPAAALVRTRRTLAGLAYEGALTAAALCFQHRSREPDGSLIDAIAVYVEHASGECLSIQLPYLHRDAVYEYADVLTAPEDRQFFRDLSKI
jgi:hypothetical protein